MNIEILIIESFGLSEKNIISDEFIELNEDLMWLKEEVDYFVYLPSYMLWCIRNSDSNQNLVCDRTVSTIAEFGRYEGSEITHLKFKSRCSVIQRSVIVSFLNWVLVNTVVCNEEEIKRSLKRW